jgi:hypothetical protein
VVWVFKDETPDSKGPPDLEINLAKDGSRWRPRLSMESLSQALAGEIEARLTDSADVVLDTIGDYPSSELPEGTRLFVAGTVEQAVWTHTRKDNGSYRLKLALWATLVRPRSHNLQGFWTKTVEVEEPHRGKPKDDLERAVHKAFSAAVDDLSKALEKGPAAEALAQDG